MIYKEAGAKVQRRTNLQISSTIIILSILTIMLQFTAYYLFEAFYIVWGISCLISVLCCHIALQQAASYEACYCFSLLTIFISLVITGVVYLGDVQTFLPFTGVMIGIVIINWLIPVLHCIIRYIFDYSTRVDDFYIFYRNISIIFLLFYLGLLFYASFANNSFGWAYPVKATSFNLLPFETIATLIEDYLYGLSSLNIITTYLLCRILIFVPYGFYIRLILYNQTRLKRLFAIMLLPFFIELMQYIIIPTRCDIDDIIYAAVGSVIGSLAFFLFNLIVRAITGRDFLIKNNDYHFAHNSLHF